MKAHQSPIATEAVERIRALYRIEKEIKGKPADVRRAVRTARARPLFDDMRRWMDQAQLAPKSETAAAIHYALGLWDALARYLDDGRIELDNPIAERAEASGPRKAKLSVRRFRFRRTPRRDPL